MPSPIQKSEHPTYQTNVVPPGGLRTNSRSGVAILPPLEHYFTSLKALEATSLEWAVVHNGTFLEYFAPPGLKTHHPPSVLAVDMAHNAAGIPGDGNQPVTFTYTLDVARFVSAALDLEAWPATRELRIVGDEVTFNELVAIAEEVKGVKFNVAYDGVEDLRASRITELPGHAASYDKFPKERLQWFLAIFELWMATGRARVPREGSLNEMFPEIKPLTVREMMERYWAPTK